MTANAQKFIQPLMFQTITKRKVYTQMFDEIDAVDVKHVSLAQKADVALIAPATANTIAKLAQGVADDMLSTVFMAVPKKTPKYIAPAMNTEMWKNPAFQRNLAQVLEDGYIQIPPKSSQLACGTVGMGAMANVKDIVDIILNK